MQEETLFYHQSHFMPYYCQGVRGSMTWRSLPVFQFPPGPLVLGPSVPDGVDVFLLHRGEVDVAVPVRPWKSRAKTKKNKTRQEVRCKQGDAPPRPLPT